MFAVPDEPVDVDGPSLADLAAIEDEWPLISAGIDLVDAEIRVLCADHGPTELDRRRLRRAEHRVLAELTAFVDRAATAHASPIATVTRLVVAA